MPLYVYEEVLPDGSGGDRFEILQSISAPALEVHPETGLPVRRCLTSAAISRPWSAQSDSTKLSDRNLDKMGFTKYVKGKNGYEKTCGDGPDIIRK
ncbi:FmdB family zinc ribbon protein [Planctopirus hydrillae]|uniref:FmdB family transcriptional regulator n=1 Tax=Planctopirus hydrillae TaxID=1841610 RepID=A0A1C3EN89_9PLAN|nr:FmdB family transcriptional regulator [Planctopirus hydrillae]ODA34688.1 FmdB family transcriptional regulator [Planctopirus hydrillae]